MRSKEGVKDATTKMYSLLKSCDRELDLPSNVEEAQRKIGHTIAANRSKDVVDMVPNIAAELGFKQDKEQNSAKQREAQLANATCPENAPIVAAFQEPVGFCTAEGNRALVKTYSKLVQALTDLDFAVTEQNALGLAKGKATKVPGIGETSAEKILEFIRTGTMEKLELMRAANE